MAQTAVLEAPPTRQTPYRQKKGWITKGTWKTKERAHQAARKGGIRSGVVRRAKKALRAQLSATKAAKPLSKTSVDLDGTREALRVQLESGSLTGRQALWMAQAIKTLDGISPSSRPRPILKTAGRTVAMSTTCPGCGEQHSNHEQVTQLNDLNIVRSCPRCSHKHLYQMRILPGDIPQQVVVYDITDAPIVSQAPSASTGAGTAKESLSSQGVGAGCGAGSGQGAAPLSVSADITRVPNSVAPVAVVETEPQKSIPPVSVTSVQSVPVVKPQQLDLGSGGVDVKVPRGTITTQGPVVTPSSSPGTTTPAKNLPACPGPGWVLGKVPGTGITAWVKRVK